MIPQQSLEIRWFSEDEKELLEIFNSLLGQGLIEKIGF